MRRRYVASTSFRRRVSIRFLINQSQIITFLILKYDIIENSRIEWRGIVLPVQMGGLLGGPKGMLAPLSNYWGGLAPPPPPPPPPGPPLPTPMLHLSSSLQCIVRKISGVLKAYTNCTVSNQTTYLHSLFRTKIV